MRTASFHSTPTHTPVPSFIRSPGGRKPLLLKYEDVAFLVAPDYGVFAIAITQPDVSTTRVVEIGDPLQDVRTNYEDVGCGEAVAGEVFLAVTRPRIPGVGHDSHPLMSSSVATP